MDKRKQKWITHWFSQDVEDGISEDFGINSNDVSTLRKSPDAANPSVGVLRIFQSSHLHWVDGPDDESKSRNGSVESLGLAILVGNCGTASRCQLVDDDKIGNAGPRIPSPFGSISLAVSRKKTGQDHDYIGNDCNEDIGTAETSQQSEIEKEKWGGDTPVDVSCPVDLAVIVLVSVWDFLVGFGDSVSVVVDSIPGSHGEIREECKCGDQSCQDVEETFLLGRLVSRTDVPVASSTYNWDTECHGIEGN